MEEKNLQEWMSEIVDMPSPGFSERFRSKPAATLREKGFHLHKSYEELLQKLTDEDRKSLAEIFDQIRDGSPQDLREIYRRGAKKYELLFGWEGLQAEGPRGW